MKFSEIILPSNIKFGYFFSVCFLILTIYLYINYNFTLFYISLTFFLTLLITTIFKPIYLFRLNQAWMFLGYILGRIISPLILGLIYYFMITPIGFIRRVTGNDELKIFNKQNVTTYWQKREITKYDSDRFYNQY